MRDDIRTTRDPDHSADTNVEELAELVRHYRVCFELWPLRFRRDDQLVQIGFELDLLGTPPGDRGSLLPGEDRGFQLFEALGRIAHWAASDAPPSVEYEFRVFSEAIHYSERRRSRPDVMLAIEIVHRTNYTGDVDAAQVECVHRLIASLKTLGVQENSWRPPGAQP